MCVAICQFYLRRSYNVPSFTPWRYVSDVRISVCLPCDVIARPQHRQECEVVTCAHNPQHLSVSHGSAKIRTKNSYLHISSRSKEHQKEMYLVCQYKLGPVHFVSPPCLQVYVNTANDCSPSV